LRRHAPIATKDICYAAIYISLFSRDHTGVGLADVREHGIG
jgi:hypothetical protein